MVDGSGQDAPWRMCVWCFISLESLVLEKLSLTHRLNIDDNDMDAKPMPEIDPYIAPACQSSCDKNHSTFNH